MEKLQRIDAYWRAANYLSVGQIYLLDNPLLTEPLAVEHIKPRLLGHWGTTPGLNFCFAHLNRIIAERDQEMIYIAGPGHGGPAAVAHAWLEGSYTEKYPDITRDAAGMRKLFRQFSFPGGVPSHVAPETPGSIHEGGELGYALAHAYGAAFDNPELVDAGLPCGVAFLNCHATMVVFSNSIGVNMPRLLCRRQTGGAPGAIAHVVDQLGVYRKALRGWVHQAEIDDGQRLGTSTSDAQKITELEREVRELRRAGKILKTAACLRCRASVPDQK
ncbi:hypothetical protein GCM10010126_67760 [Planomonospora parontospora]|uniref:Xylulose 5-phosphate/Fructose 6-phosphate phosphoketolase N-terminal domain-containing protein n=1 Tax=Planomonospora parontospora TaxID=58119 RepID=A0AA37BPB5_9ACTN|nr:hypothetical protein GCM10010126_67760 [Planomonospora parontospora]